MKHHPSRASGPRAKGAAGFLPSRFFRAAGCLAVAGLAVGFSGCYTKQYSTRPREGIIQVSGIIRPESRRSLPSTALVEVSLVELFRGKPTGLPLNLTYLDRPKEVPIPFRINYDASMIERHRQYGLQIRILNEGKPMFSMRKIPVAIEDGEPLNVDTTLRHTP